MSFTFFSRNISLAGKISRITLCIITLLLIVFVVLLNIVFTSHKLTPIVIDQIESNLNVKAECKGVNLTFFSSFPRFGVRIDSLTLISLNRFEKATADSTTNDSLLRQNDTLTRFNRMLASSDKGNVVMAQDTLASFSRIFVGINLLKYVFNDELRIGRIILRDGSAYAYIDKDGMTNWDVVRSVPQEQSSDTISSTRSSSFSKISIGKIRMKNVSFIFNDRMGKYYTWLKDINMELSGSYSDSLSMLNMKFNTPNFLFFHNGEQFARKMSVSCDTDFELDLPQRSMNIKDTKLDINGINFNVSGSLKGDTINRALDTDLRFGLDITSMKTLIEMIPPSIFKKCDNLQSEGSVRLNGTLKGAYSKVSRPALNINALISNASASFDHSAYAMERLDLTANAYLDMNHPDSSYLKIDSLHFLGASSDVSVSGTIGNILSDPHPVIDVKAEVNFTELAKTLPLQDSLTLKGQLSAKFKADARLSDIKRKDLGKINIRGFIKASDIEMIAPKDSFLLMADNAALGMGTNLELPVKSRKKDNTAKSDSVKIRTMKNFLNGIVRFDKVRYQGKMTRGEIDSLRMTLNTTPPKDTTEISQLKVSVRLKQMDICIFDTLCLHSAFADGNIYIRPDRKDKHIPKVNSQLLFDSLAFYGPKTRAHLVKAGFDVRVRVRNNDMKHPVLIGTLGFERFFTFSEYYPLPISIRSTKVTLRPDSVLLNNAALRIGHSDMNFTGSLTNLSRAVVDNDIFRANVDVTASNIDCNELIRALGSDNPAVSDSLPAAASVSDSIVQTDTLSNTVFAVPANIDFKLNTDIKSVIFSKMIFENVKGELLMRNQCIELKDLTMHTLAADIRTSMVYKAVTDERAYTGFLLAMKDIQVGRLVEFMPALDTLVPMLRSLDGHINYRMAAETDLDKELMPMVPTLKASISMKGDSLVLMDGETFSEISKMLMFKNKKRNLVDSVSVNMDIKDGHIQLHPFLLSMDRYKAAIAGKHNLDMSFNYHISILKSPVPFKMGINITGNLEDYKIRLGKAKLKDLTATTRTEAVDSTSLSILKQIRTMVDEIKNE